MHPYGTFAERLQMLFLLSLTDWDKKNTLQEHTACKVSPEFSL